MKEKGEEKKIHHVPARDKHNESAPYQNAPYLDSTEGKVISKEYPSTCVHYRHALLFTHMVVDMSDPNL